MKMSHLMPLLLAGCCCSCHNEPRWLTVAVDNRVVVQVPGELKEIEASSLGMANAAGRTLLGAEDTDGIYLITRKNIGVITDRERYYDGLVIGILKGAHGRLLSRSSFPTLAGKGIEVQFEANDPASGESFVQFCRNLLVNDVDYNFSIISKSASSTTDGSESKKRKRFFESIAVNPVE